MPKEVIHCSPTEQVHVGWDRDGHVQIASLGDPRHSGEPGVDEGMGAGSFVDLTRLQINLLIRNLRRARDAAYGRDE